MKRILAVTVLLLGLTFAASAKQTTFAQSFSEGDTLMPEGLRAATVLMKGYTRQVVFVQDNRENRQQGVLTCWEKVDENWQQVLGGIEVVLGRSGLISPADKVEGDGATPTGIYDLTRVFGYEPQVNTRMNYLHLTKEDYWVDEPTSPFYNQLVKGRPSSGSFEVMRRSDELYKAGIVIEYNTNPIVKGKGSAIFLHIWQGPAVPTAGCVAMTEDHINHIVAWLDPRFHPAIVLHRE